MLSTLSWKLQDWVPHHILTCSCYTRFMRPVVLGLTWKGKDDGEIGSPDDGRKPAIAPIQEGQHEACASSNRLMLHATRSSHDVSGRQTPARHCRPDRATPSMRGAWQIFIPEKMLDGICPTFFGAEPEKLVSTVVIVAFLTVRCDIL